MSRKEDLLWSLTVKELRQLAKKNRISLVKEGFLWDSYATRKEDMIEILLESPRMTKKKILDMIEHPPKPKRKEELKIPEKKIKVKEKITRRISTPKRITLNSVLDEVKNFKRRAPKISGKRKEKLYITALTGYLSHAFPSIEMEQPLGKGSRIDAVVGKIGIEAKYRPDQNEINRLYGQIDTYLQFLNNIIVVFFDTSSGIVNDFKKKLKRGGYAKQVEVVNI